jgi:hypothetical protein
MAMTNLLLLPHRRYIYRTPALKEVNAQALILWDELPLASDSAATCLLCDRQITSSGTIC